MRIRLKKVFLNRRTIDNRRNNDETYHQTYDHRLLGISLVQATP